MQCVLFVNTCLKKSKTLDCRCQSVCPFVIILSKYGQYILKFNNKENRDPEIFLNKQVKIRNLKNNASPNNKMRSNIL